jgi:hypothetical protein
MLYIGLILYIASIVYFFILSRQNSVEATTGAIKKKNPEAPKKKSHGNQIFHSVNIISCGILMYVFLNAINYQDFDTYFYAIAFFTITFYGLTFTVLVVARKYLFKIEINTEPENTKN